MPVRRRCFQHGWRRASVLHDVEAVDRQRQGLAEDFASCGDISVPHVAGDFGHLSRRAGSLRLSPKLHDDARSSTARSASGKSRTPSKSRV